jgi:carbon-monoxide dehydrogenase large subunit
VPAVLANAVSDALRPLGIGITELPIRRPWLWELMQRARRREG